jgi:uncharacterized protein YndB with AHSA1/START domain
MAESLGSSITRTFAAPPEAVFDAWVTPASFATWWGSRAFEVPLEFISMDVHPGGTWRATMSLGRDIPDFHWYGVYVEIDRSNKLVLTMSDRSGNARETISVTLTAVDGGTEMLFSQTGGNLTAEQYEGTTVGWQTNFDAMDTILAA